MKGFRSILFCIACILFAGNANFLSAQQQNLQDSLTKNVKELMNERFEGGAAGSLGEKIVAEHLYNTLKGAGVAMLSPLHGDDFGMANPATHDTLYSRNVVGIIPGYDSRLKEEYILLGTHLDGGGADNNASGVATLLEIAKMVAKNNFMFRRSVIVAFFGAGELANAGSFYFVNRSFAEVDKIRFMIDINSVGLSGSGNEFQAFVGVPDRELIAKILTVAERPLSITPQIAEKEPFASDYRNFHSAKIPVTLFTTGFNARRGTRMDNTGLLDYFQMSQIAEFIYSFAVVMANEENSAQVAGNSSAGSLAERVYLQNEVDKRARFLKSDERGFLKDWVYQYVKYPQNAVDNGIEGNVVVEFIVGANGDIGNVRIVEGLDEEIDKEVIRVIKGSPKWKPAVKDGNKVSVKISLSVEFKLSKKYRFGIKR